MGLWILCCRKDDIKVYLHMPQQFLDLTGRMGHKVYKGDKVQTQITYSDNHQLARELEDGNVTCSEKVGLIIDFKTPLLAI